MTIFTVFLYAFFKYLPILQKVSIREKKREKMSIREFSKSQKSFLPNMVAKRQILLDFLGFSMYIFTVKQFKI